MANMPKMYVRKALMNDKNIFYLQVKNNLRAHASLLKFL